MRRFFNHRAGESAKVFRDPEDNALYILPDGPDVIRLPADLGGEVRALEAVLLNPCPHCASGHSVRHWRVEGRIGVAECSVTDQFFWYRRKEPT